MQVVCRGCRDHLGSIREVWAGNTQKTIQRTWYYPSGLPIEKGYNPDYQQRKYNGKEWIEAHGLDVTDLGNRGLYHAINRFTSIDRFAEKYPWQSPYVHAGNNPVNYVDVNGDSIWITYNTGFLGLGGKQSLLYENGNLYNKDGTEYTGKIKGFLSKTVNALDKIGEFSVGKEMLTELQNSTDNFTIAKSFDGNSYNTGSNTIKFNPTSTEGGLNGRGTTNRPAFIGLAHEMAHALDDNRGTLNLNLIPGQTFTYAEHFATHLENQIRAEHFLPLRTHYGIDATGKGIYPLINFGKSIHNYGYDYYDALKIKVPIPYLKIKKKNNK